MLISTAPLINLLIKNFYLILLSHIAVQEIKECNYCFKL